MSKSAAATVSEEAAENVIPLFSRSIGSWRLRLDRHPLGSGQIEARYERAAARWDHLMRRMRYPAAYRTMLRSALAAYALPPGRSRLAVLDCGTGSGALASAFARVSPVPLELEAIDCCNGMLDQARDRFRRDGMAASLSKSDVRRMPFADAAFDVVLAAHVLEHLCDPEVAMAEMMRVLRPGGIVILCLTRRTLPGLYVHLKWRTRLYAPEDARALLGMAGLAEVQIPSLSPLHPLHHLSLACVGRKPAPAPFETLTFATGD
jgi:demethylmenaquinone methyltransferase/2-methoxy-6-polyprenyl-1,4-benzoquinol methylase